MSPQFLLHGRLAPCARLCGFCLSAHIARPSPLLSPPVCAWNSTGQLSNIPGIRHVAITTNGIKLQRLLPELKVRNPDGFIFQLLVIPLWWGY